MALRLYRPNPGPQAEFHRSPKRLRWLFGGNRSGKTTAGAIEAIWYSLGIHPWRPGLTATSGWVVSPTFEVQREAAQNLIRKYLPRSKIAWAREIYRDRQRDYLDRLEINCGGRSSTITFKSSDQGREAFQGPGLSWVWIDEECPMDIYTELLMRTLDCKGSVWGTMTPMIGDLYQMVTEPGPRVAADPEQAWWHLTWDDNPYLSETEKVRLLAALPEGEQDVRTRGIWSPRSGRVFKEFNPGIHIIDPLPDGIPESWQKVYGLDYGMRSPTAAVWGAIDPDGTVYIYDEHYLAETPVEDHARTILERGVKRGRADASLWNRMPLVGEKHGRRAPALTVAGLFAQYGVFLVQAAKGSGTWEARLDLIRQALKARPPRLFIYRGCGSLVQELIKLVWKPSRVGLLHESTHGPDHAIDALGYLLEDLAPILGRSGRLKVSPSASAYKPKERMTGY